MVGKCRICVIGVQNATRAAGVVQKVGQQEKQKPHGQELPGQNRWP